MNSREKLGVMLQWQIGDGENVSVFGEPWFQGALSIMPQDAQQKSMKVCQLVREDRGGWDMEKIMQLLGNQACLQIISTHEAPMQQNGSDRLIFKHTVHGSFTVK